MLENIKKSKRRRYIRYAIELKALLIIDKSISIPCIIQDFCTGGLFLGFKQSNTKIPLQKRIKIQFSINTKLDPEIIEIDVRVIHITTTGVGVAIENMPASAFNALKNQANASSKTPLNDRRNSKPNILSQEIFKNSFKQTLLDRLPQLLINFFGSIAEELEKANQRSEYFMNHSEYENLIEALELSRESFISEFCNSVIDQVNYITEFNQEKKEDITITDNSLSLIEKEDFEDWLYISAIIRKLNAHFEKQLKKLAGEFARVFGVSKASINNPISPAILCDQFRELILPFGLQNKEKSALYNIFEKTLTNNLSQLYEQLEVLLLQYKSVEAITDSSLEKQKHSTIEHNKKISNQTNKHLEIFEKKPFNTTEITEKNNSKTIAKIAGKLLDILNETTNFSKETTKKDLSNNTIDALAITYNSEDVVTAFSQIQKHIDEDKNLHIDSTALLKRLEETLRGFDTKSKLLSNSDIQHLDVYGKFFETIFNDLKFSSEIKPYLESIHLPLLSLPLQGDDFLYSDLHPARNILNQLAVLDSAVKSNQVIRNTNIKNTLDKLIARISRESGTNPNIFTEVEQELEGIAKQVTKSIDIHTRRIVEAYEGQQILEIARRSVQHEIDRRIAGKAMPTIIPTLLQSGWQQLLVMAELNNDIYKNEKQKYLSVIDDLIFWFHEQDSILKIQSGYIKKSIDFIQDNLVSVCPNIIQRNSIIAELTALLLGVGNPKARKAIQTIKITAVMPEPSIKLAEDNWTTQVEQLQVGEWLTILSGSEGFEPMKLVWVGNVLQVYVFVNRDGLNKLELSKTELADLLQSGAANRMENLDIPLMDRATNLMLQKMHQKLIYNATHDPVTDLLTRDEFVKQLKNEIDKLNNVHHMLCHIEIFDFRLITNICGVSGGKQLLKRLTQLMRAQLRSHDLFARLGDKSFAVLFKHCSTDQGYEISKKLLKIITDSHFKWQEKSFAIGMNMGLVSLEANCYDVHQLLQQADSACLSAERNGQNRILMFTNDDESLKHQNKLYEWIGLIDNVFSKNRLFLRCQMIAPIAQENKHRQRQHYEILLGVNDGTGNIIPPDHFIPAVERCKRMPEIDQWIIKNAFSWIEANRNDFDKMDGFSINLSGQSINSEEFLDFLKVFLESSSFPPNKLTFEITETVAAENLFFTKKFINTIKQFNCKFSLDDFGSGYSSYSYLKNLNVDYLKIDGAFVKDIANNKADIAIVKSMNEIAHSLGLKTIAEYVENKEILEILKEIGVDYAQGYGIEKPIPITDLVIEDYLTKSFPFNN